ncbi:uncharacterized protein LOC124944983 [Impatiens glandulifera]|uniref:uncharacterized protein LOC124944983 n=1 Tax=Impatiens glandulifera TaxID=253017 RepID=UPI001FB0ABCE|nr:uncharacterized protein LOC124944983 [Impatiens glandulifera]
MSATEPMSNTPTTPTTYHLHKWSDVWRGLLDTPSYADLFLETHRKSGTAEDLTPVFFPEVQDKVALMRERLLENPEMTFFEMFEAAFRVQGHWRVIGVGSIVHPTTFRVVQRDAFSRVSASIHGYHTVKRHKHCARRIGHCGISQEATKGSRDLKQEGIIKTIETDNGEIIDCVEIQKQPSLVNSLINDLQMEPSDYPFGNNFNSNLTIEMLQDWHKNGDCPEATIPIRRNTNFDHLYPKKPSSIMRRQINQSHLNGMKHEYAVVSNGGSSYHGASGIFNVWNPKTEDNEFSLSQIWVVTSYKDYYKNLNTIEVGWMVNPINYHDKHTRIFIYWTRDAYKTTGCYDLNCKGFVQTNRKFSFGMPLSPMSIYGGQSMQLSINIFKDKTGNKWWLQLQGSIIGYWPVNIFTDLKNNANIVDWGGEIVNQRKNGHHTTTQMGSGEFPNKGFGKSCFISNLKVLDAGFIPRDPGYLIKKLSKPTCYDLTLTKNKGSSFETHIFYGGPGFSPTCR